jgi:hypothetical protein
MPGVAYHNWPPSDLPANLAAPINFIRPYLTSYYVWVQKVARALRPLLLPAPTVVRGEQSPQIHVIPAQAARTDASQQIRLRSEGRGHRRRAADGQQAMSVTNGEPARKPWRTMTADSVIDGHDLAFLTPLHGSQHHALPCGNAWYRSRTEEVAWKSIHSWPVRAQHRAHPGLRSRASGIPTRRPRSKMPSGVKPATWLMTPARHSACARKQGQWYGSAEPPIMR